MPNHALLTADQSTLNLLEIDIEEELNDSEYGHAVVYCPEHEGKHPLNGAIVDALCGRLFRVNWELNAEKCPECDELFSVPKTGKMLGLRKGRMSYRFTEGRAWLSKCPLSSCESPVIEAHVNGLIVRLSTKAIPLKDALIFQKYERIVINVWKGPTQLWATAWHRDQKNVDKGHLYVQHIHGARK